MQSTIQKLSPLTEASFYVLLALIEPKHGYGIIKSVEELTGGRIVLAAGTLYGVLQNFEKQDCIELESTSIKRRKKVYRITAPGRDLLQFEITRLQSMLDNAKELGVR